MSTAAAPPYTVINMDEFENTYINSEIKYGYFHCARSIGDIFIIYKGGEAKLNNFLSNQNMMYDCTIARYGYAKWTYNIHIYIYIEHRNLETRKTLTTS